MLVGVRFSAFVQTGPGAHPATYTMGTRCSPGVKRLGRGVDHPRCLALKLKKECGYPVLPLWAFVVCPWAKFAFYDFTVFLLYCSNCMKYNNVYSILHLQVKTIKDMCLTMTVCKGGQYTMWIFPHIFFLYVINRRIRCPLRFHASTRSRDFFFFEKPTCSREMVNNNNNNNMKFFLSNKCTIYWNIKYYNLYLNV
jgi:hypothetical protein